MKVAARIGWAMLALALAAMLALLTWEPFLALAPRSPPPRAYAATIVRDEFGVPHIRGRSDPDVAFGIGWAHAEDDFSTLQEVLAMTRGRYGALAGEKGARTDFAFHLLDVRGTVRRHYAGLPGDVRALLEGYASGLNLYAARHPGEVTLARLFPVDGRDIAAGFALRQPFFFSLDKVIGPLAAGEPPRREHGPALNGAAWPGYEEGGGDQLELPLPLARGVRGGAVPSSSPGSTSPHPAPPASRRGDDDLTGSNAFAVAPARSPDGATRLVSNAHQPWRGGAAWYELVVDSDSGWHFAGATFPGAPMPLLGHNATLGWTNTVNRPDLADIYRLVLSKDRTRYRLDGKWLPLARKRVILPLRLGPVVLPVVQTVWRSRHGPALLNLRGGFAFRYAGIDSLRQITQYYRLSKARSFAEWHAAMALRGVPSTNFVYADRTGRIALAYNAAIPARPAGPDWRGIVPGDDSALIWRRLVPQHRLPLLVDPASGYVFNANNTPFAAAGPGSELDPAAFPPEWGIELDLTNRARRALRLLGEARVLGRMELARIKYDTGYERTGYVAWMLDRVAALPLAAEPELARAQALLARWDLTADGRGPADALAVLVLNEAMRSSYGLKPAPDPRAELAGAVAHLTRHFGRIDPPLGALLRLRQGPGPNAIDLPLDGGGDTLRAMTSWNVAERDGRLLVKHGDSFIQWVEWPKDGPVQSHSIQPFGQAITRPRSPHFADQAPLFAAHRLKPVHFTRAQVAAHAVRRYRVSNR